MTKAQQIAQLQKQLLELGRPVSVDPIPDQDATAAPANAWLTSAATAIPAVSKPVAAKVYTPKPIIVGYVGIYPKPDGEQFEPYTMLSLANQANGRAHRDHRLNQRFLDALKGFVGQHGWTLPKPTPIGR